LYDEYFLILIFFLIWMLKYVEDIAIFDGENYLLKAYGSFFSKFFVLFVIPIHKFRTMKVNAEKETGPVWARKDDPRVTPVGAFLRKSRLDELPQIFNVFKGEMSFIGLRPIRKFFADKLSRDFPFYFLRFYIKPGLTGWAQVSAEYDNSMEWHLKKLEYELFYMQEYTLFLDAVIILKTIKTVVWAKGN